jgi:hypothetical protein
MWDGCVRFQCILYKFGNFHNKKIKTGNTFYKERKASLLSVNMLGT